MQVGVHEGAASGDGDEDTREQPGVHDSTGSADEARGADGEGGQAR